MMDFCWQELAGSNRQLDGFLQILMPGHHRQICQQALPFKHCKSTQAYLLPGRIYHLLPDRHYDLLPGSQIYLLRWRCIHL
jgi:hypothetical protein